MVVRCPSRVRAQRFQRGSSSNRRPKVPASSRSIFVLPSTSARAHYEEICSKEFNALKRRRLSISMYRRTLFWDVRHFLMCELHASD
ncbi:unnamed protein product, partial [Iphiclides podalirius]